MTTLLAVAEDVAAYININPYSTKHDIRAALRAPNGNRWTMDTIERALTLARNYGWTFGGDDTDTEVRYCVGREYVMSSSATSDDLALEEMRRLGSAATMAINDIVRSEYELQRPVTTHHRQARGRKRRAQALLNAAINGLADLMDRYPGAPLPRSITKTQQDGTTLLARVQAP